MAGKSLAETLLIRPGASLWFSPIEWLWILGPLPPGVRMTAEFAAATIAVVFVSNAASVRWFLNQHRTVMALPPVVWMCYPTRGGTDMPEHGQAAAGLDDVPAGAVTAGRRRCPSRWGDCMAV